MFSPTENVFSVICQLCFNIKKRIKRDIGKYRCIANAPSEITSGLAAGSTRYKADVNKNGQAKIVIPINLPPGENG